MLSQLVSGPNFEKQQKFRFRYLQTILPPRGALKDCWVLPHHGNHPGACCWLAEKMDWHSEDPPSSGGNYICRQLQAGLPGISGPVTCWEHALWGPQELFLLNSRIGHTDSCRSLVHTQILQGLFHLRACRSILISHVDWWINLMDGLVSCTSFSHLQHFFF